jgi:hypothetical protein
VLSSSITANTTDLQEYLSAKNWPGLKTIFLDNSHEALSKYFDSCQEIKFVTFVQDKLTYKAKFEKYAEVGTILYKKKEGKYQKARIINQISPLYFIESFNKYKVQQLTIKLGDARVSLQDGHLYESVPFKQVMLFKGRLKFEIEPSDEEERLTLQYLFRKNRVETDGDWGIFVVDDKSFLKDLEKTPVPVDAGTETLTSIIAIYKEYFGIKIQQFDEFWFLPFNSEDNLVIFKKNRDELYLYDFNPFMIPDTQLRTSKSSKVLLAYNALKKPKFIFDQKEKIEKLKVDLFYNPETDFLSGTVRLSFQFPANFRVIRLAEGLKIRGSLDPKAKDLSVLRKNNVYYFLGADTSYLSFFWKGSIKPHTAIEDVFKQRLSALDQVEAEDYFYLSREQNYYPNPGIDFAPTECSISVPSNLNCLASGQFEKKQELNRNIYLFKSPGLKGISLACGNFKLLETLKGAVPIKIYSDPMSRPMQYFDRKNLAGGLEFLISKYGPPATKEINILFQKGYIEGGVSNQGFILFNYSINPNRMMASRNDAPLISTKNSPINFRNESTDYLIHELAHQWWGGITSWESYRDMWITEGLAQFSVLYFLQNQLPEKRFNRILKKTKRWILNKSDTGPIIYGKRVSHMGNDRETFQTIVYNKTAYVLLMLKEIMGEKSFLESIRSVLQDLKFKSVNSMRFISHFSQKNETIRRFLRQWVYSRKIPKVSIDKSIKGSEGEIRVSQKNTDFIFPLRITIQTDVKKIEKTVVIDSKEKVVRFQEQSPIRSIQVDDRYSLIKVD